MAQYAIAFDISTSDMRAGGMTQSEITRVYQTEIPEALNRCGFTQHLQGSLYATEAEKTPLRAIMQLQNQLQQYAPNFCQYATRIHVFRLEDWSDVTDVIGTTGSPASGPPSAEEEIEEQEVQEEADVA